MRKTPLNYFASLAAVGIIWFFVAVPLGNYLGDNVVLETLTTEKFLNWYRAVLGGAALVGWISCVYWFFYGTREVNAGNMKGACRVWNFWFVAELIVGVVTMAVFVYLYLAEALVMIDYVVIAAGASLLTWAFFWLCTWIMSPRAVMYCVLGRR